MNKSDIMQRANQYQDYMVNMRREFHQHPELSGKETWTRERLIQEIEKLEVPYRLLPGTGIIAIIEGGKPGKHRVIRADIDGLPVAEEDCNLKQKKSCVSATPGVSHTCGHDAHMAMLLGTMHVLVDIKEEIEGTVYCCFEEGEEIHCGVTTMLEALTEYPIDECFALHVYSGLAAGKINVVPGPRMAGMVRIGFHVCGKGGHGSRPDQSASPIIPAAHIITQVDSAFVNQIDAEQTVTLGFSAFQSGKTHNVIPEKAFIAGSARYFNKAEGEKALNIINTVAVNTAACHKCSIEFEPQHEISLLPVVNDEKVALRVQEKLHELCGEEYLADCPRWYGSECFSQYLEKYPGAMGFLGIQNEDLGSGAAHHNVRFDIDESVFPLGVCAEVGFILCD